MAYTQPTVQPMGIPAHQSQVVTPVQPVQTVPTQYMPVQQAPVYHHMPGQPMMTTPVYPQTMQPMGVPMSK